MQARLDHPPELQQPRPHPAVGRLVSFPTPVELALRLAQEVAEAADADQSAIVVDGLPGTGDLELADRVPRQWLDYMNGHRPAVYRLTVPLRCGNRELGLVRLGTSDPAGFNTVQITRAHAAANHAAERLDRVLSREGSRRGRRCGASSRAGSSTEPILLDRFRAATFAR